MINTVSLDSSKANSKKADYLPKMINCMIVPTGTGAKIGGFAGDANPVAKRIAALSDILITHPNVVNAAMFTDIAPNILVLEGALLDLFFQEKISIQAYRSLHRIAVVMDKAAPREQVEISLNCMSVAKHVYGLDILPEIVFTEDPVGVTENSITRAETLLEASAEAISRGATALALLCLFPDIDSSDYVAGKSPDPIGYLEAQISHLVSSSLLIPSAHAPVFNQTLRHSGIVFPRVAAEHLGFSYLPSVFKCLEAMPPISVLDPKLLERSSFAKKLDSPQISVRELSHLIAPYSACKAVPMQACAGLGIELITIEENTTVLLNQNAKDLNLEHFACATYLDSYARLESSYELTHRH